VGAEDRGRQHGTEEDDGVRRRRRRVVEIDVAEGRRKREKDREW